VNDRLDWSNSEVCSALRRPNPTFFTKSYNIGADYRMLRLRGLHSVTNDVLVDFHALEVIGRYPKPPGACMIGIAALQPTLHVNALWRLTNKTLNIFA
jgi:hypothetical protein